MDTSRSLTMAALRSSYMAHSVALATLGLTKPNQIQRPKILFAAREVDLVEWKGDILAVGVTEKDMARDPNSKFQNLILQKLDSNLGGMLSKASSEEDFSGKSGQSIVLRLPGLGSKRIGLVGLGSSSVSSTIAYRSLGETIAAAAKSAQASSVAVALASVEGLSVESKLSAASAMATGIVVGTFEDNRFKLEPKTPTLKSVEILGLGTGPEIEKKLKYSEVVSSGVIFVKELVNAPANVLTPGALAEEAKNIASLYSDVLTATILDVEQCKELKMGSFLGVAAAATNPSYFIHLCYKPSSGSVKTKLALVGKGITFDSGGYNIKAGANSRIEIMKNDMSGAAVVLGAAKAMGQIKPAGVEVHFLTAACENMISGTGMRPGDIITASNGKRIEVNNTDAEGRLALADTLIYACKLGVEKIVDLATLTGACITALGPSVAGVFTPSEKLAREVLEAAEVAGEKLWRLPMEESYWENMKSGIADMVNTGPRDGGAITAALFLKQFVDEEVEWLHIDIAGPVFDEKKQVATGFGISTMVEWVLKHSS
ncbi:PREDICTED: leucine aminopeptidase 2, chloroplastic-like isoform X2 [Ipomoea nil]|uniref:leucine aminopeptidase 2, chloroplastic-like isoform X2 n=1 Tax=Ipomoea nil TaxID=35883 RepID=UPI0009016DA9|nr:PREDICTED: leucine aminopeptidase 2, chloroplastic-like isoform X2 [Ipomoea nil]